MENRPDMILEMEQINRELYEANFRIRRGNDMAGTVHVKGRPGQMDAEVQVRWREKQACFPRRVIMR